MINNITQKELNMISAKTTAIVTANRAMNAADKSATEALNTINKKDVLEDINDLITAQHKLCSLHNQHYKNLKKLLKIVKKERKLNKKNKKKVNEKKVNKITDNIDNIDNIDNTENETLVLNSLTKPLSVKKELCNFLKKKENYKISRKDTIKEIGKYIKKHKLYKENKLYWTPDEELIKILSPLDEKDKEKGYSYFNLTRYINHIFN